MEVEDFNSEDVKMRCMWGAIFMEMGVRTNQLPNSGLRKAYLEEHLGWELSTFLYEAILAMHKEFTDGSAIGFKVRFKDVWTFQSPHDPNASLDDFIENTDP